MAVLLWLIIVIQAVTVIIFIKVSWWLAIVPEMFVVLLIAYGIFALFRRCPVCGKRRLTIDLHKGGGYIDFARCRSCKSHVSIHFDKKTLEDVYYVENEHGQEEKVVPIWKTSEPSKCRKDGEASKRKKSPETPKHRKGGEVSKRIKSRKTSGYVKDYDTSNYRKA